jgi:L-lysine 2,3-aminomutase
MLATRLPEAGHGFPLRVPRGFVARMRRGDAADPLLRQILPLDEEDRIGARLRLRRRGRPAQPRRARRSAQIPGTRIADRHRQLCVHCRYCFRRHFPYGEEVAAAGGWQRYARLPAFPTQHRGRGLLSGGDPLSLATAKLAELTDGLRQLPHLRRLRIHTRLPVVLPERVDTRLLDWLAPCPGRW